MARALIVGCGCRGTALGGKLRLAGWEVRGTSRRREGRERIAAAGLEAASADPDRGATVLELVGDVAVLVWALGSARGTGAQLDALHGPRLERVLERLVETPVRGFVYEARGSAGEARLERGARLVRAASERWRLPVRELRADAGEPESWAVQAAAAVQAVVA